MTDQHLPECGSRFETDFCICERLVACEKRVRADTVSEFMSNHGDTAYFNLGYDDALSKAETMIRETWAEMSDGDPCLTREEQCPQCASFIMILDDIANLSDDRVFRAHGFSEALNSLSNVIPKSTSPASKVVGYINTPIDSETLSLLCLGMDDFQFNVIEDILVIERKG